MVLQLKQMPATLPSQLQYTFCSTTIHMIINGVFVFLLLIKEGHTVIHINMSKDNLLSLHRCTKSNTGKM